MNGYGHGGDIYRNKIKYDHSVSINPTDWPQILRQRIESVLSDSDNISTYPDLTYERLTKAVSEYTSEPKEKIVVSNGASEMISAIFYLFRPKRVLIPAPFYSGYERAAKQCGAEVIRVMLSEEKGFNDMETISDAIDGLHASASGEGADIVVIGNPSNPVGNLIFSETYKDIVGKCEEKGVILLSDECFAKLSMTEKAYADTYAKVRGRTLVKIRALTKSFRLAGLRLGYAIFEDEGMAGRVRGSLPEWNVSTPAMKIGTACLEYEIEKAASGGYMKESYEYIRDERKRVSEALSACGIRVYDGSADYILIKSDADLYEKLLEKGILIRDCSDMCGLGKGFYRISLRSRQEDDLLMESIRECYEKI